MHFSALSAVGNCNYGVNNFHLGQKLRLKNKVKIKQLSTVFKKLCINLLNIFVHDMKTKSRRTLWERTNKNQRCFSFVRISNSLFFSLPSQSSVTSTGFPLRKPFSLLLLPLKPFCQPATLGGLGSRSSWQVGEEEQRQLCWKMVCTNQPANHPANFIGDGSSAYHGGTFYRWWHLPSIQLLGSAIKAGDFLRPKENLASFSRACNNGLENEPGMNFFGLPQRRGKLREFAFGQGSWPRRAQNFVLGKRSPAKKAGRHFFFKL